MVCEDYKASSSFQFALSWCGRRFEIFSTVVSREKLYYRAWLAKVNLRLAQYIFLIITQRTAVYCTPERWQVATTHYWRIGAFASFNFAPAPFNSFRNISH